MPSSVTSSPRSGNHFFLYSCSLRSAKTRISSRRVLTGPLALARREVRQVTSRAGSPGRDAHDERFGPTNDVASYLTGRLPLYRLRLLPHLPYCTGPITARQQGPPARRALNGPVRSGECASFASGPWSPGPQIYWASNAGPRRAAPAAWERLTHNGRVRQVPAFPVGVAHPAADHRWRGYPDELALLCPRGAIGVRPSFRPLRRRQPAERRWLSRADAAGRLTAWSTMPTTSSSRVTATG